MSQLEYTGGLKALADKLRSEFPDMDDARLERILGIFVEQMKTLVAEATQKLRERAPPGSKLGPGE